MPEYSNYLEGLPTVGGALSGDEIIGASKDGDAVGLTAQQIADLGGGGGTWGSITGTLSDQTDLNTALGLKAPLASPTFTGTPTAPTAAPGTNDTQVATTAFVVAAIGALNQEFIQITDDVTNIGASTTIPKKTFYMPVNKTIDSLMWSLTTAQASGSIFTVDIHLDGTTVLSTKATIDNTENTSLTAATPYVLTDNTWAQGQKVEVFVDQVGNGTAVELIMYIGWH